MNQQYNTDFYAWTNGQVDLLKKREFQRLDMENLIEEIESLGNSTKSSLESYLLVLLHHKLKIDYHPKNYIYEIHLNSWSRSINNSSRRIFLILKNNPSLKYKLKEIFHEVYQYAREDSSKETGLDMNKFPEECPWNLQDIFPALEKKYC